MKFYSYCLAGLSNLEVAVAKIELAAGVSSGIHCL